MAKRVSGRAPSGQALAVPAEPKVSALTGFDPSRVTPQAFVAWVGEQDAAEDYDYSDPCGCAFALFLDSLGAACVSVDPYSWSADDFSGEIERRIGRGLVSEPWTFGALAERLAEAA